MHDVSNSVLPGVREGDPGVALSRDKGAYKNTNEKALEKITLERDGESSIDSIATAWSAERPAAHGN